MNAAQGFQTLHEDDALLVVNKPSGIATQAPREFDSLEQRIRAYLAAPGVDPTSLYLGIPHRLDRAASGVIAFAKTRRAARHLSKQFERRKVHKIYWACVERIVEPFAGTWCDFLHKVYGQPRATVVDHTHPAGQEAVLHYRTLGYHAGGSWLEIELETGRTHQIRVQAASRGHALLGDTHYGATTTFGPQHDDERLRAIALHARALTFWHPVTRKEMTVEAPPSDAWQPLRLEPRDD